MVEWPVFWVGEPYSMIEWPVFWVREPYSMIEWHRQRVRESIVRPGEGSLLLRLMMRLG